MSGKRWGRSRTGGADLPKRSMYENAARKPAAQEANLKTLTVNFKKKIKRSYCKWRWNFSFVLATWSQTITQNLILIKECLAY